MTKARIGIIMGSSSDLTIMQAAAEQCERFEVPFEITIVSAHRTPQRMVEYAQSARERGIEVIVAGAGGAAHLPGMVASLTSLPVIGVPIKSSNSIDGWDSVLSILQMPSGIPVATVALNGAANAGLLALRILGSADGRLAEQMDAYRLELEQKVMNTLSEPEQLNFSWQRKSEI
jgi:5-(carboxyamino)imidazole ribonucleotide mutase